MDKLLAKEWISPNELQQALYDSAKEIKLSASKAFSAIYLSLIGKTHGPKAAWLLIENKNVAKKRFSEIEKINLLAAGYRYSNKNFLDILINSFDMISISVLLIKSIFSFPDKLIVLLFSIYLMLWLPQAHHLAAPL